MSKSNAVQPSGSPEVNPQFEPILTKEQVAARLQIHPTTVYSMTRRRQGVPMPAIRVGKFLRFRWSEVEKWLAATRQAA